MSSRCDPSDFRQLYRACRKVASAIDSLEQLVEARDQGLSCEIVEAEVRRLYGEKSPPEAIQKVVRQGLDGLRRSLLKQATDEAYGNVDAGIAALRAC